MTKQVMDEKEIIARISGTKVLHGEEIYLNRQQSIAFVEACNKNQLIILGIEGFFYEEPSLTPDLGLIADFSINHPPDWAEWQEKCYSSAKRFLAEAPKDDRLVFSFVTKAGNFKKIQELLSVLRKLLQSVNEVHKANQIEDALAGSDDVLKAYITSNELWGGSGSIADLIIKDQHANRKYQAILAELGELQIRQGLVNERTEMWTKAFRENS